MSDERLDQRLHREVRHALDRGYRPLSGAQADRILAHSLGDSGGDAEPGSGRHPASRLQRSGPAGRQWLAAAAALLIAALAVATLLGVRAARTTVPAGHGAGAVRVGQLDELRAGGRDAVAAGRNDATAAAFLAMDGAFSISVPADTLTADLERQARLLESSDRDTVSRAAADASRAAAAIHQTLLAGLPVKAIVVSLHAQQLWAYDRKQVFLSTPVTTGQPSTPTDVGPMRVLRRAHPYQLVSPWPPGSPNWYPTTIVQYMISISDTGVGIHDAPWQSCCFGPGSERSAHASRGTIHVPSDRAAVLYGWSDVGTPVVVLPGDGTPVSRQTGAMNRPGEALHQRPLKLPAVGAGAACPGSPQRSLPIARTGSKSAAPDYGFGPGPAYLSGQLGWYAGAPGQALAVVVDPSYSGPLLIRVRRLDGTGTADLQPEDPPPAGLPGAAPPGTAGSDGVDVHVTGAPPAWTAWMGRLTLDSPGCYGMQVDGAGFTSDIVFRVQPGPIPPG